jgi:outer membrane autotransporter protein
MAIEFAASQAAQRETMTRFERGGARLQSAWAPIEKRERTMRKLILLASTAPVLAAFALPAHAQTNNRLTSGEWADPDPLVAAQAWERQRPPNSTEAVEIATDVTLAQSSGVADRIWLDGRLSISQEQTLTVGRFLKIGTTLETGGDIDISDGGQVFVGTNAALDTVNLEIGLYGQGKVVVTDGLLEVRGGIQVAGGRLNPGSASTEIFERLIENSAYVPPYADGTLEVSGADAKVVGSSIKVGNTQVVSLTGYYNGNIQHLGGNGVLIISRNGTLETQSGTVDKHGIVTISTGGKWDVVARLIMEGKMTISSGDVNVTGNEITGTEAFFQLHAEGIGNPEREIIGTLTIDGASSRLSVNGTAEVQRGDTRTEQLTVTRGGTFQAERIELDGQTVSRLTNGGRMLATGRLVLTGGLEDSLLSIESGSLAQAKVVSLGGTVGSAANGDRFATMVVTGEGSRLNASELLMVATRRGRVRIEQGATATSPVVWIGQGTTNEDLTRSINAGVGEVIVDGAGSRLIASEQIVVGGLGDGTLRVANGGTVQAHVIYLGKEAPNPSQLVPVRGMLIVGAGSGGIPADPGVLDIATDINIGPTGTILFNHQAAAYSFGATVESDAFNTGLIEQRRGFTSLDGDMDRFTGNILVAGGSLDVNVETGALNTTVRNGARLGGRGNLAGTVEIEAGGTLAGGQGDGPLEMQTLELSPGANVNIGLTGATTPVPIFLVRGDLVLDGTLNIDAPLDLGRGLYRIFNYGGALTDRGLDIGSTPGALDPAAFSIFTGAPGQVSLNYLGGDPGPGPVDPPGSENRMGDGGGTIAIGGGGWQDDEGAAGSLRAGDFAVLTGPLTALTVDDSGGAVELAGIQFAVNGVSLSGDPLAGSEERLALRVGDGTEAGAGFMATIAAPIVGEGGIEKTDLGTLILTGANSYSGGTFVRQGVLQGSTASLQGDIAVDAELVFDQAQAGTYAGTLSGEGDLTKTGAGTLTLTGDSSDFGGAIGIDTGALLLNGLLGGSLRIGGGASLGGNGTAGQVTVASGGTIAPGGSVGTLNVSGIAFESGSIYEVELNDGGNAAGVNNDLIAASGQAALSGTVHVTPENGTDTGATYAPGLTYTILTAAGGVDGTFAGVSDDFAFLNFLLSYDGNNAFLTSQLARTSFCLDDMTANQCAVGESAFSVGGGALFDALLGLSDAEAPGALDQLSGEIHASIATALAEDSRFPRDAALQRLAAAGSGGGAWIHGFGSWGDWDGDGNAAGLQRDTGGAFLGADLALGEVVRLGAFAGYGSSGFEADARNSNASAESVHLGVYGGGQWGGFGVRAGGAVAWHEVDTDRGVSFTGFSGSLSASHDARTVQLFGEASYRVALGGASIEPFAGIAWVDLDAESFAESGGPASLTVADRDSETAFSTLGLRAETGFAVGSSAVRLTGSAGWRRAFGDRRPLSTHAFAGGDDFIVAGVAVPRDMLALDAGLAVSLGRNVALRVSYGGRFGSGATDQQVNSQLSVRF